MKCNCVAKIDERLKAKNLVLSGYALLMPDKGCPYTVPVIATDWIDPSKAPRNKKCSPTKMFASHCPFCGVKVEP